MDDITIDSGIPVPNRKRYPFAAMKVGQSFRVPIESDESERTAMRRVAGAAGAFAGRNEGYHFTVSVVSEDGARWVRVWRVAE